MTPTPQGNAYVSAVTDGVMIMVDSTYPATVTLNVRVTYVLNDNANFIILAIPIGETSSGWTYIGEYVNALTILNINGDVSSPYIGGNIAWSWGDIPVSPSITPSRTKSISVTPSTTPSISISSTPSISVTPSTTPSISISNTPSISITPTVTPTISVTRTPSISITSTPSISITSTPSISITRTPSISVTPSITPTITPTPQGYATISAITDGYSVMADCDYPATTDLAVRLLVDLNGSPFSFIICTIPTGQYTSTWTYVGEYVTNITINSVNGDGISPYIAGNISWNWGNIPATPPITPSRTATRSATPSISITQTPGATQSPTPTPTVTPTPSPYPSGYITPYYDDTHYGADCTPAATGTLAILVGYTRNGNDYSGTVTINTGELSKYNSSSATVENSWIISVNSNPSGPILVGGTMWYW